MKPTTITHTGSGSGTTNSDPVRLDWRADVSAFSFATDGSTTGFTAQFTLTAPEDYASTSAWASGATWHGFTTISGATADAFESRAHPIQGVRLQADANGTDIGTLIIVQAGM